MPGNSFQNLYKQLRLEDKRETTGRDGCEWRLIRWLCSEKEETAVEAAD